MKKLLVVLLILAVLIAGGAYLISDYSNLTGATPEKTEFKLAQPRFDALSEVVGGTGVVQTQETLVISTQLAGQVIKILKDFNDVVESGEELLVLDDRLSKQKLSQAQSDSRLAQRAIEAAQVDLEKSTDQRNSAQEALDDIKKTPAGTFSQPQIRLAESQLNVAKAGVRFSEHNIEMAKIRQQTAEEAVKLAQLGVDLGTVRVPYVRRTSGARPGTRDVGTVVTDNPKPTDQKRKYIVLERKVALNQMVGPPSATHLFTLAGDLAEVDLQVQINESDIGKVRPGQKVHFTVSAFADKEIVFTGEVVETRMLPTVAQGAVYYQALVTAKNKPDGHGGWLLRPGMTTAGVDIVAETSKAAWVIPNTALDFQLDESYITPAAKEALTQRPGEGWVTVWALDDKNAPRPIWVKPDFSGKVLDDKTASMKPEPYTLVEWDPNLTAQPEAGKAETYPKLIIGAPAVKKSGLFGGGGGLGNVIKF